jgi:hypothetical protein
MNTTVVIAIIAIALAAILLRHKTSSSDAYSGPRWRMSGVGVPSIPTMQGSGWNFTFPSAPNHVNYLQDYAPPALAVGKTLVAKFTITGGGFVAPEYPANPPLVSLVLQRKGDDLSGVGEFKAYRWFSTNATPLTAGTFELSIPLDVSAWGDIYNGQDAAQFAAALSNIENIGLVFGSNGGRGHGINASEPSTFTLISIEAVG